MSSAQDFLIRLRPLVDPTDPDGVRRLRAVLKHALRVCRLRCVAVEPAAVEAVEAVVGDPPRPPEPPPRRRPGEGGSNRAGGQRGTVVGPPREKTLPPLKLEIEVTE